MQIPKSLIVLNTIKVFVSLLCALFFSLSHATSSVYSFELYLHNEYFSQPPGFPSKISVVPNITLIEHKTTVGKEHRLFTNLLEAVRLTYKHWWIELFTSIGKEYLTLTCEHGCYKKSRTGFDDFLVDAGYNFLLDKKGKVQLLPHVLVGIPTFWKITQLEQDDPLLGTRTFALGGSLEAVYDFKRSIKHDIFFGFIFRFIHRFDRKYNPVLPPDNIFVPGNITDYLLLFHYRVFQHNIEFGYNITYLSDRAIKSPRATLYQPSTILHTVYGYYALYLERLSSLLEIGLIGTISKKTKAVTPYMLFGWYF